jgi:hypothetical protein
VLIFSENFRKRRIFPFLSVARLMANITVYGSFGCQIGDILNCDFKGIFVMRGTKEEINEQSFFAAPNAVKK